jgi:hypothetical protein
MTARSSAAVLHARTLRIRSRSFIDMVPIDNAFVRMMEGVATLEDSPAVVGRYCKSVSVRGDTWTGTRY